MYIPKCIEKSFFNCEWIKFFYLYIKNSLALDNRYFYISSYLIYSKSKEYCACVLFFQGVAYTRVVTPTQFSRVLHYLSLNVNPEELKLLLRKFQDPASGDVNYPAFVQTVDQGELELLAGS